ncbi:MAG: peptidylprolyl isomerase [Candidatus Micrarchaeota archaeon]
MVSKGDMLLLELEGRDEDGNVFDSTSGETARKLHGREGPLLLAFGTDRLIPGLFEAVGQMKKGERREVSLPPEKAFGKRKKELLRVMSFAEFRKYRVNPEPGLVIHVDTDRERMYGTVRSVGNGRVMVDFNHPFAGHSVSYRLFVVDVFSDTESKVKALCADSGVVEKCELKDGTLSLKFREGGGQEHETRKALLLVALKTRVEGLKKIDIGRREEIGGAAGASGFQPPVSGSGKPKTGNPKRETGN